MSRPLAPAEAKLALEHIPRQALGHLLADDATFDIAVGYRGGARGGTVYEVTRNRVRVRTIDALGVADVLNVPTSSFRATRAGSPPRLLDVLDRTHDYISALHRPGYDPSDLGRRASLDVLYRNRDAVVEQLLDIGQEVLF